MKLTLNGEDREGWVPSFDFLWDTEDTIKLLGPTCGFICHELTTIIIISCSTEKGSFAGSTEITDNNQPTTNKAKLIKLIPIKVNSFKIKTPFPSGTSV